MSSKNTLGRQLASTAGSSTILTTNTQLELEEGKSILGAGSQRAVVSMLKRAADKAAKDAKKRMQKAGRKDPFRKLGSSVMSSFHKSLETALKHHANNSKRQPSIKMRAPDTGGRPFHFDHSAVSAQTIKMKPGEKAKAKNTVGKREFAADKVHTSRSAAHMAYLEREGAAESLKSDLDRSAGIGKEEGWERDPAAMQSYLEDEAKLAANARDGKGQGDPVPALVFSFGTPEMGSTLEERQAFWDLAEQHARGEKGTIQHRLILELPHEATPQDRLEIVKAFTAKFEADGVPYHAVLHAPTDKNDDRNYHAHVVVLGRPAKLIDWPEGGKNHKRPDGPLVKTWDFAATDEVRDKHDNYRTQYPKRQNMPTVDKDGKEVKRHQFVAGERKRFSDVVNARMAAVGNPVRYDARSYKDMGIEVDAMKSISRIITDKARSGERTVIDAGKTKRVIEAEITRLAREREPELKEISKVRAAVRNGERDLRELERSGAHVRRKSLPRRLTHAARVAAGNAALAYAKARENHVTRKVEQAHEVRSLERVIEATEPRRIAALRSTLRTRLKEAKAKGRDPEVKRLEAEIESVPPTYVAKYLREAAQEELQATLKRHASSSRLSMGRVAERLRQWTSAAQGNVPPVLPTEMSGVAPAGISRPAPEPAREPPPPEPAKPMFLGVESVIDEIFHTPQSRVMLALYQRMAEYITTNSDVDDPELSPIALTKNLINAFKQHPLKAEQLMMDAKYGAAAPTVRDIGPGGEPVPNKPVSGDAATPPPRRGAPPPPRRDQVEPVAPPVPLESIERAPAAQSGPAPATFAPKAADKDDEKGGVLAPKPAAIPDDERPLTPEEEAKLKEEERKRRRQRRRGIVRSRSGPER